MSEFDDYINVEPVVVNHSWAVQFVGTEERFPLFTLKDKYPEIDEVFREYDDEAPALALGLPVPKDEEPDGYTEFITPIEVVEEPDSDRLKLAGKILSGYSNKDELEIVEILHIPFDNKFEKISPKLAFAIEQLKDDFCEVKHCEA